MRHRDSVHEEVVDSVVASMVDSMVALVALAAVVLAVASTLVQVETPDNSEDKLEAAVQLR